MKREIGESVTTEAFGPGVIIEVLEEGEGESLVNYVVEFRDGEEREMSEGEVFDFDNVDEDGEYTDR